MTKSFFATLSIVLTLCNGAIANDKFASAPKSAIRSIELEKPKQDIKERLSHVKQAPEKPKVRPEKASTVLEVRRLKSIENRSQLRIGTESGGGGSEDRQRFYWPLSQALKKLSSQKEYVFQSQFAGIPPITIRMDELVKALRAAIIVPTRDQLYDRDGVQVDAKNNPNDGRIEFNILKWEKKKDIQKVQIGIHEVLGLLRIPDPYYTISTKLAEYSFEGAEVIDGIGQVTFCGISVKSFGTVNGKTTPDAVISKFKSEGGQIKVCQIKDGFKLDQTIQVVVGVFIDGAHALVFRD